MCVFVVPSQGELFVRLYVFDNDDPFLFFENQDDLIDKFEFTSTTSDVTDFSGR